MTYDLIRVWTHWMLAMSWQLVVIAMIVGAICFFWRNAPVRMLHLLWLFVFLKLLVPPQLGHEYSLVNLLGRLEMPQSSRVVVSSKPEQMQALPAVRLPAMAVEDRLVAEEKELDSSFLLKTDQELPSAPRNKPFPYRHMFSLIWLCGVLGLFFRSFMTASKFRKWLNLYGQAPPLWFRQKLAEWSQEVGLKKSPSCSIIGGSRCLCLFGWFRPQIVCGQDLLKGLSPEQLYMAIYHELIHIKGRDTLMNGLQSVLQVLYWFHPVVWLAGRQARYYREMVVDEEVVAAHKELPKHTYEQTILALAEHGSTRPVPAMVGILEPRSAVFSRVARLLSNPLPKITWKSTVLIWLMAAFFTVFLIPMGISQPQITPSDTSNVAKESFPAVLNETQRLYMKWTEESFGNLLDKSEYADLSESAKAELEDKWIEILEGPWDPKYYDAINCLAAIKSKKAVKPLLHIAAERREKDNRDRWMAVRALGIIGDESVVPELIHLVYHYNQNTRLWAQISLARLTGVNFGYDWRKWGEWWNRQGKQPPFSPEKVIWTTIYPEWADPDKQKESDKNFIEKLNPSEKSEQKRAWGPEQATGEPDTPQAGDIETAWASLTPDGQMEWLMLEYPEPVISKGVEIYETYNPGAVYKVSVFTQDGEEVEVWTGKDPTPPGSGKGTSEISFTPLSAKIKHVKIYLDSPTVKGWNEIDAVALNDIHGKTQWATAATASSTYAEKEETGTSQQETMTVSETVGEPIPENSVKLSYVDNIAEGKRSLGASGHAIQFRRPEGARFVEAVQIAASRYGTPEAPKENFHLYLLNEKFQVLADVGYPYGMVERTDDLRWYTLRTPSIEVPQVFYVALDFNSHQTKGIYLGFDRNVEESHSYTGLPDSGYEKVQEKYDWMVKVYMSSEPSGKKGIQRLADWKAPEHVDPFTDCIEVRFDTGISDDMQSYGGRGPAIRFRIGDVLPPGTRYPEIALKGVRLYASRYGSGYDPAQTMVKVYIIDESGKVYHEESFPYALFSYKVKWVDLVFIKPFPLKNLADAQGLVTIAFDPEAHQYKGIYFYYNRNPKTSHSLVGSVKSGFQEIADREWIIRAYFSRLAEGQANGQSLGMSRPGGADQTVTKEPEQLSEAKALWEKVLEVNRIWLDPHPEHLSYTLYMGEPAPEKDDILCEYTNKVWVEGDDKVRWEMTDHSKTGEDEALNYCVVASGGKEAYLRAPARYQEMVNKIGPAYDLQYFRQGTAWRTGIQWLAINGLPDNARIVETRDTSGGKVVVLEADLGGARVPVGLGLRHVYLGRSGYLIHGMRLHIRVPEFVPVVEEHFGEKGKKENEIQFGPDFLDFDGQKAPKILRFRSGPVFNIKEWILEAHFQKVDNVWVLKEGLNLQDGKVVKRIYTADVSTRSADPDLFSLPELEKAGEESAKGEKDALLAKAGDLYKNKELREAIEVYKEIYEKYPDWDETPQALIMIGECYDKMGQKEEALEVLEKAASAYPHVRGFSQTIYFRLGEAYIRAGEKQKAYTAFLKAAQLSEGDKIAYKKAAYWLEKLGPEISARFTLDDPVQADAEPPQIVTTIPTIGATDVDPSLKEIVVIFDRDMSGGFSWTGGGEVYPKTTGTPFWRDSRTCVLPVALESGKFYRVGINSKSYQNFRSKEGVPASPTAVYFTTAGAPTSEMAALTPPTIVSMSPANGAKSVSPATTELRVTFDQEMGGGCSWTGGGDHFPEVAGNVYWTGDKKTCVLPVKLKPNWSYRLGLNSVSHKNFQSAKGVPLEPVAYTFETGMEGVAPKERANLQQEIEKAQAGGVVMVPPGKHSGPLQITKPLTLRGQDAQTCIIELLGNEPTITIRGTKDVVLENLTVRWAPKSTDVRIESPAAIDVRDSDVVIRKCHVEPVDRPKDTPYGLMAAGRANVTFTEGRSTGFAYALIFLDGANGTVSNSILTDAGHSVVTLHENSTVKIIGNILARCVYHAVRNTGGTMDMTNNLVIGDNRAGAYLGNKSAHGRIANNLFSQNRGAIWSYAYTDVVIENNVFYAENGPGVGFHDTCNLTIRRNSFVNNAEGLTRYSQEGRPPGVGALTNCNHFWNNKEDFVNFDEESSAFYGDPKFTDAGKGDFSLQKGSPLLDEEGKPLAGLTDPEPIRALWATWATLNH